MVTEKTLQMQDYGLDFYKHMPTLTRYAAETILAIVQHAIPEVKAAIDIGCGVGTWLNVLRERGTSHILGVDGNWVPTESLVIPSECYMRCDLSKDTVQLDARYDLVISLEVAEHLPSEGADQFIMQLTQLGDFVLFSAAIPGQGGTNHINEQWPEYWTGLFQTRGYAVFDIIRTNIWTDEEIPVHYRQNILLFVKHERVPDLKIRSGTEGPLAIVHPQLFMNKLQDCENPTIRRSLEFLGAAVMKRIKRELGRAYRPEAKSRASTQSSL